MDTIVLYALAAPAALVAMAVSVLIFFEFLGLVQHLFNKVKNYVMPKLNK